MADTQNYLPPSPRLKAAMTFLDSFFFDENWETARERITSRVAWETERGVIACQTGASAGIILTGLSGIEALLADPSTEPGVLPYLAEVHAGWGLPDPREEQAKAVLQKIAEMVREVLGERQP